VALAAALSCAAVATPAHAQEQGSTRTRRGRSPGTASSPPAVASPSAGPRRRVGGRRHLAQRLGRRSELFRLRFPATPAARLGLALGSVSYELGRTRRHLVLTAHFGGGVRFPSSRRWPRPGYTRSSA